MRVIKPIQIKEGDVIRYEQTQSTVRSVGQPRLFPGKFYIQLSGGTDLILNPTDEVVLVRRPWPHGATEVDMRNRVARQLTVVSQAFLADYRDQELRRLQDAIDDYLTGGQ